MLVRRGDAVRKLHKLIKSLGRVSDAEKSPKMKKKAAAQIDRQTGTSELK